MYYFLHVAHPFVLYILFPVLAVAAWWRYCRYNYITFTYALTDVLKQRQLDSSSSSKKILFLLRLMLLSALILLIARLQLVDQRSQVEVEGIDMMLVLDVSGSMSHADDQTDRRTRIEAAKQEAIKFIQRRNYDPIGLVLFGKDAVSRCPLTLDKNILTSIIQQIQLGVINPDGTVLSTALSMAVNRLKNSKAKNKIIIALTDGEPNGENLEPDVAITLAKKFGIKIYTIGIGSDKPQPILVGCQVGYIAPVNKKLLSYISQSTGGKFFEAKKPQELEKIYQTIDQLEKTKIETDIYTNYYDIFMPLIIIAWLLALLELLLASFVWFIV